MFFIAGVYPKRKELDYNVPIMCNSCSKYGRYEAFMEYSVFSLFFIPLIKFNKKYYIKSTCCNSLYLLKKEKGFMMERGQGHNVVLKDDDLKLIQKGISYYSNNCSNCGYQVSEEHKYCPNCGNKL